MSMETERPEVSDLTMAILKESLNEAADRLAAKQASKAAKLHVTFTAGHVYAIIFCLFILTVAVVGAFSK